MVRGGEGRFDVAIVGGGASGVLVAVQLLRRARWRLRIALIDAQARFGRGLAYSTKHSRHLLNVPSAKMSAFPDDPLHFVRWLSRHDPDGLVPAFARREQYGCYLEDVLMEAMAESDLGTVELIVSDVVDLTPLGSGAILETRRGDRIEASAVVLALGNFSPANLRVPDGGLYQDARYHRSAWARGALESVPLDAPVLLLGTGLTTVDVTLALEARGHQGTIHALSRHGLLPQVHRPVAPAALSFRPELAELGARRLLKRVRAAIREEQARGGDWRAVVDALRPTTQALWRWLPPSERRRFLRHLRPYWDIHRHRMAPQVGTAIELMRASGRLQLHAGHVLEFAPSKASVEVRFRPRGAAEPQALSVSRVINCTGPAFRVRDMDEPLMGSLFEQGLARPDPLGLGLDVDELGQLRGEPGAFPLHAVGPLRRGLLWESTAIPEIREQASALAQHLLARLPATRTIEARAEASA